MRLLPITFLFLASACGQARKKHVIDPQARKLYDTAFHLGFYSHDYSKAITFLDSAIQIDSTYFNAYSTKIGYEAELKQYDKALETAKRINRIRPEDPQCYVTVGFAYLIMKDSVSAKGYFKEADKYFDKILDTLSKANRHYDDLLMNKAMNLVFIGETQKGLDIMEQLYAKSKNDIYKDIIHSMKSKTSKELLDEFFNGTMGEGKAETHTQ